MVEYGILQWIIVGYSGYGWLQQVTVNRLQLLYGKKKQRYHLKIANIWANLYGYFAHLLNCNDTFERKSFLLTKYHLVCRANFWEFCALNTIMKLFTY